MDFSQVAPEQQQTAAPEQTAAAPAPADRQSQEALEQFHKLMQRENMLRKRESGLSELQKKAERLDKILASFNGGDIDSGLGELGVDYDKLTSARLSSMGSESDRKLAEMTKELEAIKKRFQETDEKSENEKRTRAYQQVETEVRELVDGSDDFELIKALGMHDMVLQVAADVYHSTGKSISTAEAAKEVEAFFEKRLEQVLQAKKVASRLSQQPSTAQQPGVTTQTSTKTLSSELGQESRTEPVAMSREELFERAMRKLQQ
jgi:hypothetical protein